MTVTFAEGLASSSTGGEWDMGHQHYGYLIIHEGEPRGVGVMHPTPDGMFCGSSALWDVSMYAPGHEPPCWTLNSLEPVDISPSLLCRTCGDHGFVKQGRWVPA